MAELKLIDVNKSFGNVVAVQDVNLTVEDQEFVVLVGPSGCGKTTTLRMIAGLETVDKGHISIGNRVVNDLAPRHRDVAVVFQNYALYPHMTIFDNMAYGLKRRKFPADEIRTRVNDAANILGITNLLQRHPKQLSGGQQQRVALGRAIVRQPAAFLFDEPLSALDAKLRVQMRAELSKLHERLQSTMIYVTHDQIEAMTMGDRIVVMCDGEIQQVGPPKEIYNQPINLFVAGFVGSPPMNQIRCAVQSDGDDMLLVTEDFRLPLLPNQINRLRQDGLTEVIMGVRMENLHYEPILGSETFPKLSTVVEVIEPLGPETHLFITTGKHQLISRVSSHIEPETGDHLEIMVDMNRIHLFNVDTEERIDCS